MEFYRHKIFTVLVAYACGPHHAASIMEEHLNHYMDVELEDIEKVDFKYGIVNFGGFNEDREGRNSEDQ